MYSRCVSMSQQVVGKILKAALSLVGIIGIGQHEVLRYLALPGSV
ncbi:hypothetical protein GF312_17625 [Candidatus Poribacteria bacterium]|nr:hypothetical protein [Candidatus Poribacteria bacterium]